MLDETLRKMRDTQTEIDDRTMRVRQMLHQKVKEQQALKRKALIKGKHAVAAHPRTSYVSHRSLAEAVQSASPGCAGRVMKTMRRARWQSLAMCRVCHTDDNRA